MLKDLFSNRDDISQDEIYAHIERLWNSNNDLAQLIKTITDVMKNMAEAYQVQRTEIEQLAKQTLMIAEQQNRLLSHVLRKEDMMDEKMESTSFH